MKHKIDKIFTADYCVPVDISSIFGTSLDHLFENASIPEIYR